MTLLVYNVFNVAVGLIAIEEDWIIIIVVLNMMMALAAIHLLSLHLLFASKGITTLHYIKYNNEIASKQKELKNKTITKEQY